MTLTILNNSGFWIAIIVLAFIIILFYCLRYLVVDDLHPEKPSSWDDERSVVSPDLTEIWALSQVYKEAIGNKESNPPSLEPEDNFPTVAKVEKITALEGAIARHKQTIVSLRKLEGRGKQIKAIEDEIKEFESSIKSLKGE